MSRFYKLHELIEMAKSGKSYKAHCGGAWFNQDQIAEMKQWHKYEVAAQWTVTFNREPRTIWVSEDRIKPSGSVDGSFIVSGSGGLHSDLIKFIEVIDQ